MLWVLSHMESGYKMKKYLYILFILYFGLCFNVKAECEHQISIKINGDGMVVDKTQSLEYRSDIKFNVTCGSNNTFILKPSEYYKVDSFIVNNESLEGKESSEGMSYRIKNIDKDLTIVANFKQQYDIKLIKDGINEFKYIDGLDKIILDVKQNGVEMNFVNIKDYINEDTTMELSLNDTKLYLNNEFLQNQKDNLVKISFKSVSDNVLSEDQIKLFDEAKYYELSVLSNNEKIYEIPGSITLIVPYENQTSNSGVYYIDNDGNEEELVYSYDDMNMTFSTSKTGIHVIVSMNLSWMEKESDLSLTNNIKNTVFTILLVGGFIVYMIVDYVKNNKNIK